MVRSFFILFVCILFVVSCTDDDSFIPLPQPEVFDETRVNLMDLVVGQETQYMGYSMNCDDVTSFAFTGDTLVVTVVEMNGLLHLEERFTAHSASMQNGQVIPVSYSIESTNGTVTIAERLQSYLFFFYGSDYIHLDVVDRIPLVQSACRIMLEENPFIGNEIGHVMQFEVGPVLIEDKTAVSCVPTFDLDAYLLYDRNQLYLSHQIWNESFGGTTWSRIQGWKMLDD